MIRNMKSTFKATFEVAFDVIFAIITIFYVMGVESIVNLIFEGNALAICWTLVELLGACYIYARTKNNIQ